MKRGKPTNYEKERPPIMHPFGGHIPYPPEDCPFIHKAFTHHNTTWLDAGICHKCEMNPCQRRKEWK